MTDADYAVGICLFMDTNKTEFMYFKQKGALKLVDKSSYLGSNTESDVNIRLAKARPDIYRLSVIRKFHLSDKIKRDFFQGSVVSIWLNRGTT